MGSAFGIKQAKPVEPTAEDVVVRSLGVVDDEGEAILAHKPKRGLRASDVHLFFRRIRTVPVPGFGSITLDIDGFSAGVSNLTILRDEDGAFRVRPPFSESPDKRSGAEWGSCEACESRIIVPPADADLTDVTRPWIKRWPTVSGDLSDAVVRVVSGLAPQCDVCQKLKAHKPEELRVLMLRRDKYFNDIKDLPKKMKKAKASDEEFNLKNAELEALLADTQAKIDKSLEVCGAGVKAIVLTDDGFVECSAHVPAARQVVMAADAAAAVVIESGYNAAEDDGEDIPF